MLKWNIIRGNIGNLAYTEHKYDQCCHAINRRKYKPFSNSHHQPRQTDLAEVKNPVLTNVQTIYHQTQTSILTLSTANQHLSTATMHSSNVVTGQDHAAKHGVADQLRSNRNIRKRSFRTARIFDQSNIVNDKPTPKSFQLPSSLNQLKRGDEQPLIEIEYNEFEAEVNPSGVGTSMSFDMQSDFIDSSYYDIQMDMMTITSTTKVSLHICDSLANVDSKSFSQTITAYDSTLQISPSSSRMQSSDSLTDVSSKSFSQTITAHDSTARISPSSSRMKSSTAPNMITATSTFEVLASSNSHTVLTTETLTTTGDSSVSAVTNTPSRSTPSAPETFQYPEFIILFGNSCGSLQQHLSDFANSVKLAVSKSLQIPMLSLTVRQANCTPFSITVAGQGYNYQQVINISRRLDSKLHHGLTVIYNHKNFTATNASVIWHSSVYTLTPITTSAPLANFLPLAIALGSLALISLLALICFCLHFNFKLNSVCQWLTLSHFRKDSSSLNIESERSMQPLQSFTPITSGRVNKHYDEMDDMSEIDSNYNDSNIPKAIITSPSLQVIVDPILNDTSDGVVANETRM